MHKLIARFADICLEKQIIQPNQVPWFIYGLEKRILTILFSIPFILLSFLLSSVICGVFFFASFYCLRKYIGGFHANSVFGCLIISLISETAVFLTVYPVLNTTAVFCTVTVCVAVIYILAPYNHPNMHLTAEEAAACKKWGRGYALGITAFTVSASILGFAEVAKGSALGIALASAMLCLGYIFDRRIQK